MEGLPIHIFDSSALYSIANLIGKPLKANNATIQLTRPSVARVFVELDLSKELPTSVWIHLGKLSFLQPIHYEDLPAFCTSCTDIEPAVFPDEDTTEATNEAQVATEIPNEAEAIEEMEGTHFGGTHSTTTNEVEGAKTIDERVKAIDEGTDSAARTVITEGTHSAAPIEVEGAKAIDEAIFASKIATEAVTKGTQDVEKYSRNTLPSVTGFEKLPQQSIAHENLISNDVSTISNATPELSSNKVINDDTKASTESPLEETPHPQRLHLENKDLPPTDLDPPIEEFPQDELLYPEIENDPRYKEVLENMRRNNPGRYGNMSLNQIDDFIEKRSSPHQFNSEGTSNLNLDDFQEVHHKRTKNTSKRPSNPQTVTTRNYDPTLEVRIVSLVPKYWPSRKTTTMERIITAESYTCQFWNVGPVGPIGKDGKRPKKVMPKNKTFDEHPGFIIWE
ncbi:unnamed protein product [Cuscuta campestris]|uniref:Uncharacterized protein n=1 Tax=Cuscuta campestris TaxID=132261 RepID=A0A484KZK1_9ASTE|nr:unnamed protein product [Cuscuta campestris]